jgi:hypothetical protein
MNLKKWTSFSLNDAVLSKGTTFIRNGHIWFNLTEPDGKDPHVLCVNFTCLDEQCPDDECQINSAEYNWVKDDYPTVIAFSRARLWDAGKIVACLKKGLIRKPDQGDVPPATVAKVIQVALKSRELSADFKLWLT